MSKAPSYLLQGKNIILVIDGKSHTISKDTHISYGKILDALKAKDWASLRDLVEPKKAIFAFSGGNVSVENNQILWKGKPFHNALATRMIEMFSDGFPIDPMVNFMENLMNNPSKRSVDQVYGFLDKNNLPITEDGYFLAFKKVKAKTYMDIHSGTIRNAVGDTVEMDRNLVDDNPDSHCSVGLHFCSISYLSHFGSSNDPIMIVKINPADVVSIPTDYNGAKGRCCKYEVVAEVVGDPKDAFTKVVNGEYNAKPAAKAPVVEDKSPAAAWPYPTGPAKTSAAKPAVKVAAKAVPAAKAVATAPKKAAVQLYDLRRVNGNDLEFTGVTLDVARAQKMKNHYGKKAQLKIVEAGTNKEVQ
jgi:hypothetical protein